MNIFTNQILESSKQSQAFFYVFLTAAVFTLWHLHPSRSEDVTYYTCDNVSRSQWKPLNYLLDFADLHHAHSHFSLLHIFFTYKEGYRDKKLHLLDDFLFRSSWCPVLLNRNFNLQFFPPMQLAFDKLKKFQKIEVRPVSARNPYLLPRYISDISCCFQHRLY